MHQVPTSERVRRRMSPHMDNRFKGHMAQGDPRDLMWACGGCNLPTIMAHNFLLCSTNATGVLEWLNTEGVLFIPNTPLGSSWEFWWKFGNNPAPVTIALMKRTFPYNIDDYRIELQVSTLAGTFWSDTTFPRGDCNKTHPVNGASLGFPVEIGNTGDDLRLMQVEWDQTRPPGGWPP